MSYNEIFRAKTKKLSVEIIKTLSPLKYSDELSIIRKQIFRSSTSIAANYRAVGRARSNKERYAKMCIVVEETDETLFWLEILEELELITNEKLQFLYNQTEELLKVMSSYRKSIAVNI